MAEDGDLEKGESSLPVVTSRNLTKESTTPTFDLQKVEINSFQCRRCERFETQSHSLFLVHSVQCTTPTSKQDYDVNSNEPSENGKTQQIARKHFECDVCNMKFSNGANMRRHKMRHTGVKPYECRVCQKRFFRKDHLAEHFTTHTKTLPYHCPICNRGFQRQIAMRAHFQNEHVGQHDLVKTCPLCSYRGGSMKSLRVHFFNRHGIDLDNPGSAGSTSLLLSSDIQGSGQYHSSLSTTSTVVTPSYSDSGESFRSIENATPPMHFLTPQVEISIATNNENVTSEESKFTDVKFSLPPTNNTSDDNQIENTSTSQKSNSLTNNLHNNSHIENHIVPSINLVPIKQEQNEPETYIEQKNMENPNKENNSSDIKAYNSIIKVSPLKSLLREDLKRRICARASSRATRNLHKENNNILISGTDEILHNVSTAVNRCYTTNSHELDLLSINRKKNLQCKFCRIEFPDQTLYFLHKGCHSDSNPWKCNICGEQCNSVYEFNSHLLSKSHQ